MRILVRESPVEHVGDRFEPAVWMPVGAPRLAGFVFDFTHLVHMHERIEICRADAGERAHDGETLTFVASWAGGDGPDRSFSVGRRGGGDTRQCQGVSGDS